MSNAQNPPEPLQRRPPRDPLPPLRAIPPGRAARRALYDVRGGVEVGMVVDEARSRAMSSASLNAVGDRVGCRIEGAGQDPAGVQGGVGQAV